MLRLPKTNTTSQVGTVKQSYVSQNQGTKSTAKEQSIKTYTPYNPSIKKEPVYIDTVVPLSANAIANLRKANMSTPVSQTKQQSKQQSSTVSQTKQQSKQQSSTVSQTKQQSLTLTNQNLLVSTVTPSKKKGITEIILHPRGVKEQSIMTHIPYNLPIKGELIHIGTSKNTTIHKLPKLILNRKLKLTRR